MQKLLLIGLIVIVVFMVGYIFFGSALGHKQSSSVPNASVTPTMSVKDFAPNVPMSQKTTIIIESSDSSMEKYIVPTDQVNTYIKSLPEGYHVVSKSP